MNETHFDEGEKIQIFDDFYVIGNISRNNGIGKINLKTRDPEIFEAYLEFSGEKIILFTTRKLDSPLKNKGFRYHDRTYQVVKQHWENEYIEGNWHRNRIHEIKLLGEKGEEKTKERQVIEDGKGNYIFHNWEIISEDDIEFEPGDTLSDKSEGYSRKFQIKFKEQP